MIDNLRFNKNIELSINIELYKVQSISTNILNDLNSYTK